MEIGIRWMALEDWGSVRFIYLQGLATGEATLEVGLRKRIGRRNGIWRDTVLLERRSKLVGNE